MVLQVELESKQDLFKKKKENILYLNMLDYYWTYNFILHWE